MIAVVLCAGFGTRMYPLTEHRPKPLLDVGGRPALDYIVDQIVDLPHIEAVHIVSNDKYYDHFVRWRDRRTANFAHRSIPIRILDDGATANENRLGAVKDLRLALKDLPGPEKVLVSGADNVFLFPILPIWQQFLKAMLIAFWLSRKRTGRNCGGPACWNSTRNDRVMRLREKSPSPPTNWFCPPLYFFQASVRSRLDAFVETSNNCDAPGHFIDYLCQIEPVHACRLVGWRLDIGHLDAYREADRFLCENPI